MARYAQPDTAPAPQHEVYAGVHAGPPTYSTQPAMPIPGQKPATPESPRRTLRDRMHRHRNRHAIQPWRCAWLIPVGLASHLALTLVPFGEYAIPAVLVVLGVIIGGRKWAKQTRKEFRAYAAVCVTAATAWMLYITEFGMWGPLGKFTPIIGVTIWAPLAVLWWERHRARITDRRGDDAEDLDQDPFMAAWEEKVEPKLNWHISTPEDISTGSRYRVQLVPGQAIEDATEKIRAVASYLRISRSRLTFEPRPGDEPGDSGDESVVSLIVTRVQNPQHLEQTWQGPSLDKTTGLYGHGVYPDRKAFMRLFQVEDGVPHRAKNGMWSGTTGSGKSRGLAIKIAEHILSGMYAVWYADGKEGASAPELDGHVDWYSISNAETSRMLRAAWKVMKVRKGIVKRMHQAAFRGQKVIYLGHKLFPMLQIFLDEAQEFFRDKVIVKLAKALQRMGNEVGIGVDIATQVPLLNELGGESGDGGAEVIRDTARAGNQAHYRAQNDFSGTVELGEGMKVVPKLLPGGGGWCYISGYETRAVKCKTYYASKTALAGWLADAPVVTLEEASARAAGEDYATRHQRAKDADVAPEEVDLDGLESELAILLGEKLPGQMDEGQAADELTIKQAVFNAVRDNGGPMKRDEIAAAVAGQGKKASDSSINQQLKWWCEHSHLTKVAHGVYDLTNREGAEVASAGV